MSALPEKLLSFQRNLHQEKSKAVARVIIDDYFTFFNYEKWKTDLWQMLVGTLSSEQMDKLQSGIARHNLFFFYEYTVLLLEAVSLLHDNGKKMNAPITEQGTTGLHTRKKQRTTLYQNSNNQKRSSP